MDNNCVGCGESAFRTVSRVWLCDRCVNHYHKIRRAMTSAFYSKHKGSAIRPAGEKKHRANAPRALKSKVVR